MCDHIWLRRKSPKYNDEDLIYVCKHCKKEIWATSSIPQPICKHNWMEIAHELGPKYIMKRCTICNKEKVRWRSS
jgi:hypothetical protein